MTTETPTSGIARATAPSELGASESEHRDTVNLHALDLEGLKRVAEAGVAAADDVSGRIHAGGYRGNLSDTEDLRNHVRRLAKATFTLLSRLETAEAALQSAQAELKRTREAMTPSAATKAAYYGKFSFPFPIVEEDDCEVTSTPVPWITIKEIMAAIRARAALQQNGGEDAE